MDMINRKLRSVFGSIQQPPGRNRFGGAAMLPVGIFVLGLVGIEVHTEKPAVELRAGAHRTHARLAMTRATAGVAVIARYIDFSPSGLAYRPK